MESANPAPPSVNLSVAAGRIACVRMVVVRDDAGWCCTPVQEDGSPAGPALTGCTAAELGELERRHRPRWVWAATASTYPALLATGLRLERCHDLGLTENLLRGREGRPPVGGSGPSAAQSDLFDLFADAATEDPVADHADQLRRITHARAAHPGFGLLVAAESAAALAAAEMGHAGLPWDVAEHDRALSGLLGARPRHGGRPPVLQELAQDVAAALDSPLLNPDSPQEVVKAFARAGVPLGSTRAQELQKVEHPAVAPLLRYKELARLHVAHGWAWQDQWVRDGRFHPQYVPGGVVSGRWAARGGGALQLPRQLRGAVRADPGWKLVSADAGQLEPRVLAALSGDQGMIAATRAGDLYAALAQQLGGASRPDVKIAMLSVMYGGGTRTSALVAMGRRYPQALAMLERAARIGEDGGVVTSVLGRTCPPPPAGWQDADEETALARGRARGRFTRNFVIQASAADWANVLVAELRRRLADRAAQLVFFQHDEVMVHAPGDEVDDVVAAVAAAGDAATGLVLGGRGVAVPLVAVPVDRYAEKP
jgi:DNA polymerase-1